MEKSRGKQARRQCPLGVNNRKPGLTAATRCGHGLMVKILTVRLQNLNSLSGEQVELQFGKPPLAQAGLILICGPTGAGKSTLLDAITLALYGRAARFGSAAASEMMSQGAGECLAEVEFATGGREFRATWRLRRARGRADGNLQPVERRLADVATGEILAEKAREVDDRVAAVTGLDMDRFLRSVLLAQGQFAAFLKSKSSERAELLERVTGTAVYADLSRLAFEVAREKEAACQRLRERLEAVKPLEAPERGELEMALREALTGVRELTGQLKGADAALAACRQRLQWHGDLKKVEAEALALEERRLELAASLKTAAARLQEREQAVHAARRARADREPVWEKAVALAAGLRDLEVRLEARRGTHKEIARRVRQGGKEVETLADELERQREGARVLGDWLEARQQDSELGRRAGLLRPDLAAWRQASTSLAEALRVRALAEELEREETARREGATAETRRAADLEANLRDEEKRLELLRRQVADQEVVVEAARRTMSHEDARADLEAGQPCPLCGATDHPYAKAGALDFVSQHRQSATLLKQLKDGEKKKADEIAALRTDLARCTERARSALATADATRKKIAALNAPSADALEELCSAEIKARLPDLGEDPDKAEAELQAWEQRARVYAEKSAAVAELQGKRQAVELALQEKRLRLEADQAAEEQSRLEGEQMRARRDQAAEVLQTLLEGRTLEEDRARLATVIDQAERSAQQSREGRDALAGELATCEGKRANLLARAADLRGLLARESPGGGGNLEELTIAAERVRTELGEAQTRTGTLGERKQRDDELRRRVSVELELLGSAEDEARRWGRLRALIGSADGAKFSRFAQGLSLRRLLHLANWRLEKLAPRYRLEAAVDELEIRVVDLFQGGASRSMESLSGGETFLASLALALALSHLASHSKPIDSLFIDEGFGSLDSETLETALAALENLQATGKTIGLISHVELLKERIATQIRVTRASAGSSRVEVA